MPMYRVQDDEVVSAANPKALVEYLASTSMVPVSSPAAYRVRAAHWVRELFGAQVRTFNDDVFVEDMIAAGAYQIEETN